MIVKTCYGPIEGEDFASYTVFRGVPYAKAPLGDLRWRAPKPCEPWTEVRDCTKFGAMCPQAPITEGLYGKEFYTSPDYPAPEMNEDCLYLNIWAPTGTGKTDMPVALWIHGGAFDHGWGSEMEFDGLQWSTRDVILVTINYRVGVFGFFAHEDLKAESPNGSVGNYGILDQIVALKWVRENIRQFGGNPNNINIFGQSAGAMSVQTLVTSPLSKDLISGAILQSGGGHNNGFLRDYSQEEAFAMGKIIMEEAGVSTIEEMREVPAEKFVEILPEVYKKAGHGFRPIQDGYVMNEPYDEAIANGHIAQVPYMIGMTANDIGVKPGEDGKESPLYKGCINWAEAVDQPTFVYYFRHPLPGDEAGCFHSSELWYTFGSLGRCWRPMTPRDFQLSSEMIDNWTSFCAVKEPGHGWKAYKEHEHFRFVREFE